MLKIGLTGGMASGKSTFCHVWESLGAYVVKADDLAKTLMATDEGVRRTIKETFGPQSYDDQGNLNRAYLADAAFLKGRVNELNAIVHPVVAEQMEKLIVKANTLGKSIFLYEAAILLQKGRPKAFDYIIWVESEKKSQVERTIKRSEISSIEAEKRLHLQPSLLDIKDMVDHVVYNTSSVESFINEAKVLFHQFAAKAGSKEKF